MIQAPAYFSCCFYFGYFQIGSLHPPAIWLRDNCVLFSPKFRLLIVTPSIVRGQGAGKEYVCSYNYAWDDMAVCHSTPFGSTLQWT